MTHLDGTLSQGALEGTAEGEANPDPDSPEPEADSSEPEADSFQGGWVPSAKSGSGDGEASRRMTSGCNGEVEEGRRGGDGE